jgi:hypothetical protein
MSRAMRYVTTSMTCAYKNASHGRDNEYVSLANLKFEESADRAQEIRRFKLPASMARTVVCMHRKPFFFLFNSFRHLLIIPVLLFYYY